MPVPKVLRKEEVIDRWSVLIGDAQGKAEDLFQTTQDFIAQTKAPNLRITRKRMAPSFLRGLLGAKRDFLVITEKGSPKLRPYQMFIGIRDYGNNLDVSWYLTYRLSFGYRLLAVLSVIPLLNLLLIPSLVKAERKLDLDLFDEQDLRAYVTNAHHCLLEAVEKLMLDLNQDPSKIDRRSKGFLGIS